MNFSTFYKSHLLGKILAPKINKDMRILKKMSVWFNTEYFNTSANFNRFVPTDAVEFIVFYVKFSL